MRLTRRGRLLRAACVLIAFVSGIVLAVDGFTPSGGPPQPAGAARPDAKDSVASATAHPADAAADPTPRPIPPLPASPPTRIVVPYVRIDAPVGLTGLNPDGSVAAPNVDDRNLAAWYEGSPAPGAEGTSVVVGHVDVKTGPAVFYKAGSLRKGDTIRVLRADGVMAVFTIYGIQVFAKRSFPVERVYGGTGHPELRIITCGGTFDSKRGYSGNVVVFARLTARM
ncbi:class F sortase [Streptodolium elevatio]|uniref:Class F sortase n=1 Tax=Streptodolium elevatio TaxID=3157996 RepID=A0ABV3DV24_9ACTN